MTQGRRRMDAKKAGSIAGTIERVVMEIATKPEGVRVLYEETHDRLVIRVDVCDEDLHIFTNALMASLVTIARAASPCRVFVNFPGNASPSRSAPAVGSGYRQT